MKRSQYNVGFAQLKIEHKQVEKNLDKIIKITKENDFYLLVFPELSLSGYAFDDRKELQKYSFKKDDKIFDDLVYLCKKDSKTIIFGFSEKENNNLYNSALVITNRGKKYIYRKTHLFFNEKKLFKKGDTGFSVIEIDDMKVGVMICFDWIFPEAARTLALKGADILAHPSNLVMPYCQNAMITRSLENRIYSITANRIGKEKEYKFTGQSQIVSPDGEIVFRAEKENEKIFITWIDLKKSRDKKINLLNDLFKDRRGECYEV
ncbi:MAG: nitrilase-related carbon-nitrogen hydrolase [candidate division WOR-3 bacterium]